MIRIVDLNKSFSDQTVLSHINLGIFKGDIHGAIGGSGVDKSILLFFINGIELCSDNSIMVDSTAVNSLQLPANLYIFRKKFGMAFQDFSTLESNTVYGNRVLPKKYRDCHKFTMQRKIAQRSISEGLFNKANYFPKFPSCGQKQQWDITRISELLLGTVYYAKAISTSHSQITISILLWLQLVYYHWLIIQQSIMVFILTIDANALSFVNKYIVVVSKGVFNNFCWSISVESLATELLSQSAINPVNALYPSQIM